jgi:glyoxalase superfamily protein/ClpA/ClpB-like protein
MRDFRDAKAMAQTRRAALAARHLKITVSQSLELIAEAFGVADWNTLAAAIRSEALVARKKASPPPRSAGDGDSVLPLSPTLAATLHRALVSANQRKHQYATLEHLLLALIDDTDASAAMQACNADLRAMRQHLAGYLDNDLKKLVTGTGGDAKPTAAFQRVLQRAARHAQEFGHPTLTGADTLVALFAETQSPAARLLGEQGVSREDVVKAIGDGKGRGDAVG